MGDRSLNDWINNQERIILEHQIDNRKFRNMIIALLSIENNKTNYFFNRAINDQNWHEILLECLPNRSIYNEKIIQKFLSEGNIKIINYMISDCDLYTLNEMNALHDTLIHQNLAERDKKWSIQVNELYDWNGSETFTSLNFIGEAKEEEQKKAILLLIWLTSTSYPKLRKILVRHIVNILEDNPILSVYILRKFHECDDSFIQQTVYCAIYGYVLISRDKATVSIIAKTLYDFLYSKDTSIPTDLLVRQWSMRILEKAYSLDKSCNFFTKLNIPFVRTANPFDELGDNNVYEDENYFGKTLGSHKLRDSLMYDSDFSRYIIGTNTFYTSPVFVKKNTKEEIPLESIVNMIAVKIKKLGWNDILGEYDDDKYSLSRHENEKERIGKKYLWMAYFDVMGRLSDHFSLIKDYWQQRKEYHDLNYPWNTGIKGLIDPTLHHVTQKQIGLTFILQNPLKKERKEPSDWFENPNILPETNLELKDNEGNSWILMVGYDSLDTPEDDIIKESFLYYNSAFVKEDDVEKCKTICETKDFYGRIMPERSGSIDYLWNEYPWASSVRELYSEDTWIDAFSENRSIEIMQSYVAQLQEDRVGFDDSINFSANVYMPCIDIMDKLDLYTAERGVIRSINDNSIVALDFRLAGYEHEGMIMRKDALNTYLKLTDYKLFCFGLGEKVLKTKEYSSLYRISKLSFSYMVDTDLIKEIQPIRIVS